MSLHTKGHLQFARLTAQDRVAPARTKPSNLHTTTNATTWAVICFPGLNLYLLNKINQITAFINLNVTNYNISTIKSITFAIATKSITVTSTVTTPITTAAATTTAHGVPGLYI